MAKKNEYFKITSRSNKTTSFSPAALQKNKMGNQSIITIEGMIPRASPSMLKPVFTCINRDEKEALLEENSFLDMKKKGLYEVRPIAFADMPAEDQQKYNRKLYNELQAKKEKSEG